MTREQWSAEERRKLREREALLKELARRLIFEKDPRMGAEAATRSGSIKEGG